jgi:ubiquinone/menaquinone biosynthesis C-methylase UbiE
MATVLHDLMQTGEAEGAVAEIRRVLKPGGMLAVIEFKKIEGPPGPPMKVRLTADRTEQILNPLGFNLARVVEVGPHNYLSRFYAR